MTEDIAALYKQILDASYNVYGDLNKINSAMSRSGVILGRQVSEMPVLTGPPTQQPGVASVVKTPVAGTAIVKAVKESLLRKESEPPSKTSMKPVMLGEEKTWPTHTKAPAPEKKEILTPEKKSPVRQNVEEGYFEAQLQPHVAQSQQKRPEPKPVLPTIARTKTPEVAMQPETEREVVKRAPETIEHRAERVVSLEKVSLSTPTKPVSFEMGPPVQQSAQQNVEATAMASNPVSALLALVREKGSLSISDAADALHVDKSLIEKWAKILNQSSLLKIKYQMIGDMVLEV